MKVFVEPPVATIILAAFSREFLVIMSLAVTPLFTSSTILMPVISPDLNLSDAVAGIRDEPVRDMPIASAAQPIELAVP